MTDDWYDALPVPERPTIVDDDPRIGQIVTHPLFSGTYRVIGLLRFDDGCESIVATKVSGSGPTDLGDRPQKFTVASAPSSRSQQVDGADADVTVKP